MICRQHRVRTVQIKRLEQRVGRQRVGDVDAVDFAQFPRGRLHDVDFLAPQIAVFARVRIQPCQQDFRLGQAEFFAQILVQNLRHAFHQLGRNAPRHVFERQMGGEQRHAQTAAGQHHHHLRRPGALRQIFGVAAEIHFVAIMLVNHAFVHRRGDHASKYAVGNAVHRLVQQFDHIRRIARVKLPGSARHAQGNVVHIQRIGCRLLFAAPALDADFASQLRGTLRQQGFIAQHHHGARQIHVRQIQTNINADTCRFARSNGQ